MCACVFSLGNFQVFLKIRFQIRNQHKILSYFIKEILNGSDPILVIELHTGSKCDFSVFFICKK